MFILQENNKMLFKIYFFACLALLNTIVHAEAPELRSVMPSNWSKITRLARPEEQIFINDNLNLMEKIIIEAKEPFLKIEFSLGANLTKTLANTRIYTEQVGETIFYRILMINSESPNFSDQWEIAFLQTLVYDYNGKMTPLVTGVYNSISDSEQGTVAILNSIDIIRDGALSKGILATELEYLLDRESRTHPGTRKGEITGDNKSSYILMNELLEAPEKTSEIALKTPRRYYFYRETPEIELIASPCIVNPNIPLIHSLQSAFDGDLSTSYVENTEDDLIEIEFSGISRYGYAGRIAIINGYALNIPLYRANNRIKIIRQGNGKHALLADNNLSYQFLNLPEKSQFVIIEDTYRGLTFNATCIAELNVKTDHGWLFGTIDD
jgi:hypothetical protein